MRRETKSMVRLQGLHTKNSLSLRIVHYIFYLYMRYGDDDLQ